MSRLSRVVLSPWFVLGLLAAVIVAGVLVTPVREPDFEYAHLSTYAAADGGARGLHDAAGRLGWTVERLERSMRLGADSSATYAVLAPPEPLTSSDVSALLGAVWRGAGLVTVLVPGSPLGDSLGVGLRTLRRRGGRARDVAFAGPLAHLQLPVPDDSGDVRAAADRVLVFERSQRGITRFLTMPGVRDSSAAGSRDPEAPDDVALVAAGFPYGRGRVIVLSDPDLLRNMVLRETPMGVAAIRMMEWATPPGTARLVFDEYHFGHGPRTGVIEVVARGLVETRPGRLTIQAAIAALLLLAAVAPRAIRPAPRRTIERRSPLEHVGALARAYEQVGATRTATRRLLRGLRRRHGAWGGPVDDEHYLAAIASRHPDLRDDVAIVRRALQEQVAGTELPDVARALHRIEQVLNPHSMQTTT